MNALQIRANCERLMETDPLAPVSMWVAEGIRGRVMCLNCSIKTEGRDKIGHCVGCPKAWREDAFGKVEFWDQNEKAK